MEDADAPIVGLVADRPISRPVVKKLIERFGTDTHIVFIAPALPDNFLDHAAGNADEAREEAEHWIEESLPELEEGGYKADVAAVGDQDPVVAIEDLLRRTDGKVEEVVLVAHSEEEQRWAERDAFDRVRRRVSVPVTLLEISPEGDLVDTERSDPGEDPPPESTIDTDSENLPRFSTREMLAIVVGVIGTIVLFILAGRCLADDPDAARADANCVIAGLLAVASFLINVPHVIAITLFQSSGYRGMWSSLFARLSLFGTPVAVIVSALLVL